MTISGTPSVKDNCRPDSKIGLPCYRNSPRICLKRITKATTLGSFVPRTNGRIVTISDDFRFLSTQTASPYRFSARSPLYSSDSGAIAPKRLSNGKESSQSRMTPSSPRSMPWISSTVGCLANKGLFNKLLRVTNELTREETQFYFFAAVRIGSHSLFRCFLQEAVSGVPISRYSLNAAKDRLPRRSAFLSPHDTKSAAACLSAGTTGVSEMRARQPSSSLICQT